MTKQRWGMLAGLTVLVALFAAAMALPESAVEVETAVLTRGTITVTVDEEGRTRVRDRFVVAAPVGGRVTRITVKEGSSVSEGDALARISPTPEDARAVEVTRSQLAAAEARQLEAAVEVEHAGVLREQTERDLTRAGQLVEAEVLSRDGYEQARLAATSAQRQLEMRRAALRAAEAQTAAARAGLIDVNPNVAGEAAVVVRAPAAGRVLRVLQESARVVQAGTPLVEIGDATGLEVIVDVLSEDAVQITPGNPVLIEQWGGETELQGHVRLLEPEAFTKVSALGVEEQRVNVVIDVLDPPPTLGAGYRLEARIVTWTGNDVLSVPTSALFQQTGTWAVFTVTEGRAVRRPVQIGHRSADAAEILDGLSDGDRVILYPSALIDDDVRVR